MSSVVEIEVVFAGSLVSGVSTIVSVVWGPVVTLLVSEVVASVVIVFVVVFVVVPVYCKVCAEPWVEV